MKNLTLTVASVLSLIATPAGAAQGLSTRGADDSDPVLQPGGQGHLGGSAAPALPPAVLPYLYSFGEGFLARPTDVAVFGPGDKAKYVFVRNSVGDVVRFAGEGTGNGITVFSGSPSFSGIAVNDTPGHCHYGEVYFGVRASATTHTMVVTDTSGNAPVTFGTFASIMGVSCGLDGTVYVVDDVAGATYGFFAGPSPFSGNPIPDLTFPGGGRVPQDVAVDQNNVVNITYDDGTIDIWTPNPNQPGLPSSCLSSFSGIPYGIDASDPCARVWVTHADSSTVQSYLGCSLDLSASGAVRPWGVEFDKFQHLQFNPTFTAVQCRSRVFVVDQHFDLSQDYHVDVFGEDHDSAPLPVDAVAWWRLDETQPDCGGPSVVVRDVYGQVNGTAINGPKSKEAMVGLGYQFGPGSVSVPADPLLDFGAGDFTIEGWVLTTQSNGTQTILDKLLGGFGPGYAVILSSGVLTLVISDGATQSISAGPSIADGKWHHYAWVVDRTTAMATGYVDCVATPTPIIPTGPLDSTGPLRIGRSNTTLAGLELNGRLDELTMYSRALSSTEIGEIWTAQCAGKSLLPRTWTPYCTPGVSASGCMAVLSASGTASASAPSGFELIASDVEGQKDGLFFYGTNGQQANPWGNSTSFQCVAPPVIRAGLLASSGSIGVCDGAFSQDLNALWSANPAKNPGAGATVQAQLWYRDPQSASNQTTGLSDALEFPVQP